MVKIRIKLNLLNKLNSKYKIDFFKNKYVTQYTIYHKYIQDYITVMNDIDNPKFKDEFKDELLELVRYTCIQK